MWGLSLVLNKVWRALFERIAGFNRGIALLLISFVTGVVMLWIFGVVSNQNAIRRAKDKIRAHLLEILLFNDSLKMVFRAQGCALAHTGRYMGHAMVPLVVIMVPVVLILAQSNHLFESKPLEPEDAVTISARLTQWDAGLAESATLSVPDALSVETPPLRMPETEEIEWRVRAHEYGDFDVSVNVGGQAFSKRLIVSDRQRLLSRKRVRPGFAGALFHSAEPPLDRDSPIESIEVKYAPARIRMARFEAHWLVMFFIFSIVFAFLFKPFLKVEI
jgi:hypothetical protein